MKIGREDLLRVLESVVSGLSTKDVLEQSSCFAFRNGRVYTFNNEIACSREIPLDVEGAIKAQSFLTLLTKLPDETIDVSVDRGRMRIVANQKKTTLPMEAEFLLPIESVEDAPEAHWTRIPEGFDDAVKLTWPCAGTDQSEWNMTCIHMTPEFIEACDRFQISRYQIRVPVSGEVLVRARSLKEVCGLGVTEIAESSNWLHFRNKTGLVISCRKFLGEYPDYLDDILETRDPAVFTLPGGLDEVVDRAELFANSADGVSKIRVKISNGRVLIRGAGMSGVHEEFKAVTYAGPELDFHIQPGFLLDLVGKSPDCHLDDGRLYVDTGNYRYLTCTEADSPSNEEE